MKSALPTRRTLSIALTALLLIGTALAPCASLLAAPRACVLQDDLPGLDLRLAALLRGAINDAGYDTAAVSAETLCNADAFAMAKCDLLVVANGRSLPAASIRVIRPFLEDGGQMIVCGLPLWDEMVVKVGDQWTTRSTRDAILESARLSRILVDFAKENLTEWSRSSNREQPAAVYEAIKEGENQGLHVFVPDLDGWSTFGKPLNSPFRDGDSLTCFRAKGSTQTTALMLEWQEKDGSRWIATVQLSEGWRHYALPPEAFKTWEPPPDRGGKGDRLNVRNARRLSVGVAYSHMPIHSRQQEYWLSDIGTAPHPFPDAPPDVAVPHIESLCPGYQFFPISQPARIRQPAGASDSDSKLGAPPSFTGIHPRPGPSGFDKERPWLRRVLLEAVSESGDYRGAVATLTVPLSRPGAAWVAFTPSDVAFFRQPAVRTVVTKAARDLRRGLFLCEAGASVYTALEGEGIRLGAAIVNIGKHSAVNDSVRLTVSAGDLSEPAFERAWPVTVAPRSVTRVEGAWTPPPWPAKGYRVATSLLEGERVVDQAAHELHCWKPKTHPKFIEARDGGFWLDGRPWKAHGVNYLPSSGVGLAENGLFEFWLGAAAYDPEIVRRDLERIREMGMNAISVFLYHVSLPAQNLLDLARLCDELEIKVNLSLRPGTPLDFRWALVREMIERLRLAENDTVFAYDLAWEPSHYDRAYQKRYAPAWRRWLEKRHGSIDGAENAWGIAGPRENGQASVPAADQLRRDGPWRQLAADYRNFLDDVVAEPYAKARRLVSSIDPNHPVSFRMQISGDPTHTVDPLPYDFFGLRNSVDVWEPEAYGRIGDWERVKPGHFTAAYARLCDPAKPVLWAEIGVHVWDEQAMGPGSDQLQFQANYYRDFYRMLIESGADGVFAWWYPGGYRVNERSDYGILNPDGTDRPVTRVIRDAGPRFLNASKPGPPDVWIPIDRDADARGLAGAYEAAQEQFWRAVENGRRPALTWKRMPGSTALQ